MSEKYYKKLQISQKKIQLCIYKKNLKNRGNDSTINSILKELRKKSIFVLLLKRRGGAEAQEDLKVFNSINPSSFGFSLYKRETKKQNDFNHLD